MDKTKSGDHHKKYSFIAVKTRKLYKGDFLKNGRYLIGRAENCDLVIDEDSVSAIHCVIEIRPSKIMLYDMNSSNGCFVNDKRVVTSEIKIDDYITLGRIEFKLSPYIKNELPPVLNILEEQSDPMLLPDQPPQFDSKGEKIKQKVVEYPLSLDPKADQTEYIFEDDNNLYPIFRYESSREAIEVTILYQDDVFSIDYLPTNRKLLKLVGRNPKQNEIEFPYLGKDESRDFIVSDENGIHVNKLEGFELMSLENPQQHSDRVLIKEDDIIRVSCGQLSLYIRKVPSPPNVASAPLLQRDKGFYQYLFVVLLMVSIPLSFLNRFDVDEEKQKDKAPDRIASILYKPKVLPREKKKDVKPPEKKIVQKKEKPKPVEKVVKKKVPQPPSEAKSGERQAKSKSVKKVSKVGATKPQKKSPQKTVPQTKKAPSKKVVSTKKAGKPKVGHVDTFKSANFKSSVSSILSKGGSIKGAAKAHESVDESFKGTDSASKQDTLPTFKTEGKIGALSGVSKGAIDYEKGTKGLSTKKSILTAGIPSQTVVLGAMDPNIIRQILREYIPQFRYCYQQELEKKGQNLEGVIQLIFTIGRTGHVSRAGVDSSTQLPASVSKCVVNVLKGITFPAPKGGGVVDVKQPINYYPKRI